MVAERLVEALDAGGSRVEHDGLAFTHLDRVMWPESGYTKRDMVRYYARVARVMVPYLADRALMLKRYSEGIGSDPVVQQRVSGRVPAVVETAVLPLALGGRARRFVGSLETILYAAQLDAVELHAWHSRLETLDRPDWVVLDLDPGRGVGFARVVEVARLLRDILDDLGVGPVVKTSGSRGLHVYVPAGARVDYAAAARFARLVAERAASEAPRLATVERTVSERGPRVYVDHLQNARGKLAVAPYSLRARPGAPVSMPLHWEELDGLRSARAFTLADVPARLEAEGDAWRGVLRRRGSVARALLRLEKERGG
jgi:bifunctional non-homologous end joining protein LigD|nr:MAG: ATP-dependent DNA ligase [bacterium]